MYQPIDVSKFRSPGPNALHSITEAPRVLAELSSLIYAWPLLGTTLGRARKGDGHPVLVLPGFTAGDESTVLLRRFLSRLGYRALPWELGRNTGAVDLQDRLVQRFERLIREYDVPVSLVGQSLGGVYARELARQFPDRVRLVATLGSPFASTHPDNVSPLVSRLFQYLSGQSQAEMRDQMLQYVAEAPPVPCTAIYSKSDGVVHWTSCLEYRSDQSENIEVPGSHTGMAMNALVFHALADRLAQPPGEWRPFSRDCAWRALLYPEPEPTLNPSNAREVPVCAN